ncbi:MAG TPA: hypothetical protein V6D17_17615 [Candidatus Obscuribacterales bacterium]
MKHKNGDHGREINIGDRRNEASKGRNDGLDDLIDGLKRLFMPANIWKPAEQTPDDDKQIQELNDSDDYLSDGVHVFNLLNSILLTLRPILFSGLHQSGMLNFLLLCLIPFFSELLKSS